MVVIVIIGILAAIAIPKLFGMSAKAKAQEVPGAAGTWSKMQAAYLVESGTLGTVTSIAFKHPGATTYIETTNTPFFTYSAPSPNGSVATWTAGPAAALNDCTTAQTWTATMDLNAVVAATVSDLVNCGSLTPNFTKLK